MQTCCIAYKIVGRKEFFYVLENAASIGFAGPMLNISFKPFIQFWRNTRICEKSLDLRGKNDLVMKTGIK